MADASGVIIPVGLATVVNTVAAFRGNGKTLQPNEGIKVMLANAGLLTALVGVGQVVSWDLARLVAILYMVGTFLTNGEPVINWFTALVTNN